MHWSKFFGTLVDVADKYYVIAGMAFLVFYVILRKRVSWKKIQAKFPQGKDYRREVIFSTISIVICLFTVPINGWHLFLFFVVSLLYNVYGHLGFELYPAAFHRHWLGRWINTSVSHNQHHHYFKGNYGLYFLIWDRVMGTLRADYDTAFVEVTERAPSTVGSESIQYEV